MKIWLGKWNEDKTSKNVITRKLIKLMNWDQGLQLQSIELINIIARKPLGRDNEERALVEKCMKIIN